MRSYVRKTLLCLRNHIDVVVELQFRVETALHQYSSNTVLASTLDLIHDLLNRVGIGRRIIRVSAVERTERTISVAQVRVVEVGINYVRYFFVRVVPLTPVVGKWNQIKQLRFLHQPQAFFTSYSLAREDFLGYLLKHDCCSDRRLRRRNSPVFH